MRPIVAAVAGTPVKGGSPSRDHRPGWPAAWTQEQEQMLFLSQPELGGLYLTVGRKIFVPDVGTPK